MAVKYRTEYKDIEEVTTRIDISDVAWVGSVIELTAAANPLGINLPEGEEIFDPVQGSGGVIRVLAKDSDDLRSLYTPDPMKYLVTIYKGGTSASDIIFIGYVNTNFYSEAFNEYDNYPVSISFNDGLSVLSKIDYLNAGEPYTGMIPVSVLLVRTLGVIGDIYKDIRIVSDMNFDGYTISNDTVFHNLSVIQDNYYDEKGSSKNYREVLEEVLRGLGFICFTQNASFWIVDPLMLQDASYTVRVFTASGAVYLSSESISPNKGIGVTVDYFKTGTQLDFLESYSKINIEYSGYASPDLTKVADWQDLTTHPSLGAWVYDGEGYYDNETWGGIEGWTMYSGAKWYATYLNKGEEEFHAYWGRDPVTGGGDGNERIRFSGGHRVHYVPNQYVTIKFQSYTQTANGYLYSSDNPVSTGKLYGIWQKLKVRIGSYYWTGSAWTTVDSTFKPIIRGDGGRVDNKWVDYELRIPLDVNVNGLVNLHFYDESRGLDASWSTYSGGAISTQRIRDVSMIVTDSAGNALVEDEEYTSKLDSEWSEEAPTIEVLHGDSSDAVASHRGGYLEQVNYGYVTDFKYGGLSSYEHLSDVLLKKYQSQWQSSRMVLTGSLTCSSIYTSGLAKTGNIADNTHLPGKRFVLLKGTYNDRDRNIQGTWVEILPDDITIT